MAPTTMAFQKSLEPSSLPTSLMWLSRQAQKLPATYSYCLTHHHLATEAFTAGCMAGLGDYLAQRRQQPAAKSGEAVKSYNVRRSLSFIFKGLGEGIMWSLWYHWADRWVATVLKQAMMVMPQLQPATPLFVVIRTFLSLLIDTLVACPVIYALWDIPLPALLSGMPLRQIPHQVASKLRPMICASAQVWIPANLLIYNIPLRYRLIVASMTDVVWQSIVSSIVTVTATTTAMEPTAKIGSKEQDLESATASLL
ncbi:Mpv17 / PMP22 family protein [Nitzschia inconspicua]|uniref:Mpv17 / PMP22 family protein n=1 Tax=Nitzschia inconspicua TaxID=303405 RepID=A0A9K3KJW7_9STRA|nr:Mpv17 / PMP22 family protein [Nitzschia inconspicua]